MRSEASIKHDKEIRKLRNQGLLRPLGTQTKNYDPYMEAYKTFEGSILPNKYLFWDLDAAIKYSYRAGGSTLRSKEKEALEKLERACS